MWFESPQSTVVLPVARCYALGQGTVIVVVAVLLVLSVLAPWTIIESVNTPPAKTEVFRPIRVFLLNLFEGFIRLQLHIIQISDSSLAKYSF